MESYSIRIANLNDVPGVLNVLEENMLTQEKIELLDDMENKGFLTFKLTSKEVEQSISDDENTTVLVAQSSNEIIGFTLGYNLHHKIPDWSAHVKVDNSTMEILTKHRIFFHDYIARVRNTSGIGKKMLERLVKEASVRGYQYIVCEIAQHPYRNKASIYFHEQFGFNCVGTISKDSTVLGIYLLKIN